MNHSHRLLRTEWLVQAVRMEAAGIEPAFAPHRPGLAYLRGKASFPRGCPVKTYHVTVQFEATTKSEKGVKRICGRIEELLTGHPAITEMEDGSVVDVVIEEADTQ